MSIRITAGNLKGQSLKTPKNHRVIRPALAQVREAIFSSLGNVENLVFVDIFAGTGSLGFEALSRGAKTCHFVDTHPIALKLLQENTNLLGLKEQVQIHRARMPKDLKKVKITESADVIFCDPPYEKNLLNSTIVEILKQNFFDHDSLLIVEHTVREQPENPHLDLFKQKRFGQTYISYLKRKEND